MAIRTPLVIINGEIQNLPSGDTMNAAQAGGDIVAQTNDEVTAIVVGMAVYNDAADGVKKAQANASGTSKVLGLCKDASIAAAGSAQIMVSGVLTATTTQWDAVAGTTGGLTFGTTYYLDPTTPGKITSTAPTTAGQYVVEVGVALSTTELKVNIQKRIGL